MHSRLLKDRAAESDLVGIWRYSYSQWGEAQADRYLNLLAQAILSIAKAPTKGAQRDEIRAGYWSVRIERHVVFYTITEREVRIRRVLHVAMDPDAHLE